MIKLDNKEYKSKNSTQKSSPRDNKINHDILKNVFREYSMNIQGVILMNQTNFIESILKMYEILNENLSDDSKILLKDWYNKLGL